MREEGRERCHPSAHTYLYSPSSISVRSTPTWYMAMAPPPLSISAVQPRERRAYIGGTTTNHSTMPPGGQ